MSAGNQKKKEKKGRRGLASADLETRLRVARSGGQASHGSRGLQSAPSAVRSRVARLGGLARQSQRRKESKR